MKRHLSVVSGGPMTTRFDSLMHQRPRHRSIRPTWLGMITFSWLAFGIGVLTGVLL